MSLYINLTEFLTHPLTTGIQRIAGELCKHTPSGTLIPLRLINGQYVALPITLVSAIGRYFDAAGELGTTEIRDLAKTNNGASVAFEKNDTVLVPEVFFDDERIAFFRNMQDEELLRFKFIVYDLLPLTHPEYFALDMPLAKIHAYFQLIRRVTHCGFISDYTRSIYYQRLKRTQMDADKGVILPLGSDALGPKPAVVALNRLLTFSVIGTIEPRKNHELILEAFEPLLRQIAGLRLSFIGRMGWVTPKFAQRVHSLASDKNSGFDFHSAPDDTTIRTHVEQSRATIYVSNAEGYGLPPVESLWAATPVIASKTIPSLRELGSSAGIHFIETLDGISLRRAILSFLDDDYANQKTKDTASLNLPTWQSFTQEVLRWCT